MARIDINADLGESFGSFRIGEDEQLLEIISSANIACGFHGGDYNVLARTIKLAKEKQVGIGAHPGFPDLHGFGRRELPCSADEIYRMVVYQLGAFNAFCKVEDVPLQHVKPHGALYNMASRNEEIAQAIAKAVKDVIPEAILFGLCNSRLIEEGTKLGLKVAREAFADRTYTNEGYLTPRTEENAVITDFNKIKEQVLNIILNHEVISISGDRIKLYADTLCFHGDGQNVANHVQEIRKVMELKGINIIKVGE